MKDGQIVAMSHLITNPASHAIELQSVRPIRIVPLTAAAIKILVDSYPGYKPAVIPANTYEGQTADVPTIGDGAVLITSAETDEDLVYRATKALFENNAQLAVTRSVMKNFTPKNASENPPIEIHPGALRYYREVGVAK